MIPDQMGENRLPELKIIRPGNVLRSARRLHCRKNRGIEVKDQLFIIVRHDYRLPLAF
ncbi:hypothetical protein SDC9_185564 [bioreactor metagenome]|uniref:Uncharacterized protein n=1 Tax=bioreactor metagenome TaxID=1076179 RepID=A0A645HGA3_9ZZZZ